MAGESCERRVEAAMWMGWEMLVVLALRPDETYVWLWGARQVTPRPLGASMWAGGEVWLGVVSVLRVGLGWVFWVGRDGLRAGGGGVGVVAGGLGFSGGWWRGLGVGDGGCDDEGSEL